MPAQLGSARFVASTGLTPTAPTRTTTRPGPAAGRASSVASRRSAGPGSRTTNARTALHPGAATALELRETVGRLDRAVLQDDNAVAEVESARSGSAECEIACACQLDQLRPPPREGLRVDGAENDAVRLRRAHRLRDGLERRVGAEIHD